MNPPDDDNFFSRWSRRKVQVSTPPASMIHLMLLRMKFMNISL